MASASSSYITDYFDSTGRYEDFWTLPDKRLTKNLTEDVEKAFYKRCPPEEQPSFVQEDGNGRASAFTDADDVSKRIAENSDGSGGHTPAKPKYDGSLLKALNSVFFVQFWSAGVMKLLSDTLNTTTPLVNQVLLAWLTASYTYHRASEEERVTLKLQQPQGISYGIGLAFAIFATQETSSLLQYHYFMLAMTNGLCLRTSELHFPSLSLVIQSERQLFSPSQLIGEIFRKSLRLSGRTHIKHIAGQITTMIAADAARLDNNSAYIHNLWVAPIQIAIGIGLLIRNLGVSALVGVAVLLLGFPVQVVLAQVMFQQRKKGVVLTDQRVRMANEVLSGIRLVKYYAWESFYGQQVSELRGREIRRVRGIAAARSSLIGIVVVVPAIATVLSTDEVTSNVDVETDSQVQRTIQTKFFSSTLLCIAHRLNTIVYYDRILVMDAGKVDELTHH